VVFYHQAVEVEVFLGYGGLLTILGFVLAVAKALILDPVLLNESQLSDHVTLLILELLSAR
jgi:hypothetical protein